MAIRAILQILATLSLLGVFAGIALAVTNTSRGRSPRPGIIVIAVGAVGMLVLFPLSQGLVVIQPNQTGVVFRQLGGGEDPLRQPLTSGIQWVIPFVDQVTIYNVGQRSVNMTASEQDPNTPISAGAVRAISRDGQAITVDITVIYNIDPARVNDVHRRWLSGFETGFIIPQVRTEVRDAVSAFGAEDLYAGGRAELSVLIADPLRQRFESEGFVLTDVLVRDIGFTEQFANAIEEKQIAEQQAQRAVFLVQQAEQEAQQARVQAQGEADAAVIAAEGEAQSIIIRAEAESEGLAKINEVLSQNPALIQWQYVNTLGDNIEIVIIPSNTPFLFDLEQLISQTGAQRVESFDEPTPTPPGDGQ